MSARTTQDHLVTIAGVMSVAYVASWLLGYTVPSAQLWLCAVGIALLGWNEYRIWKKRKT